MVELATATETVEGIEKTGTHETDESNETDLRERSHVETFEASRPLVGGISGRGGLDIAVGAVAGARARDVRTIVTFLVRI